MRRALELLLAIAFLHAGLQGLARAGQAEHVVVIVWDGMRPDFVSPQYTPALYELSKQGTFFKNNHSSYVTSTEVNATALTTGMYPEHSGIIANTEYRSDLSWLNTYGTEGFDAVRRGDLLSDGHYLEAITLPEILQQAGLRTITAGAKPVVLLHDRAPKKGSQTQKDSVTLFRGQTLPRSALQSLIAIPEIGPFPTEAAAPDSTQAKILHWIKSGKEKAYTWLYGKPQTPPTSRLIDAWTTKALIHGLWKDGVPKYSLLWLSEPDASQHDFGPGSDSAVLGLESSDKNLSQIIKALKDKGVYEQTDLFIVSDHGFSTVDRGPEIVKSLKKANFVAGKQFENPEPGDVMTVNLGGSTFFYVFEHEETTIRRLVEFLQMSDYAGVIFAGVPIDGTFPLSKVRLDPRHGAPDVIVSMRWDADRNDWGTGGMVTAAEGKRGRGTHASLSRFDLHNTLIAAGPDIKKGFVSDLPSGNIDVAPTILAILGISQPHPMDGRVLTEALASSTEPPPKPAQQTIEAARDLGYRAWRQSLTISRMGPVEYFDEGSGESRLK